MELSLDFVCQSVGGSLLSGRGRDKVNGVEIDSRRIKTGDLFIPLQGENFDAHRFVNEALCNGAVGILVSRVEEDYLPFPADKALIMVDDTLAALQRLAEAYRRFFKLPVVAVTGSVGKTTTKDIIASCLQTCLKTLKTEGNFNNDIGLPLTLLQLEAVHEAAVVEMAMRAPGEIARLAAIAKPGYAVICNVEPVHLETMHSLENIARAKCEVLGGLEGTGFALINGDNHILAEVARHYDCPQYTFGYNKDCDLRIEDARLEQQGLILSARLLEQKEELFFPLPALKLASNVIAAAGLAYLMGISLPAIQAGLLAYKPSDNRLSITALAGGGIIINDSYNANPVSMVAALETGKALAGQKFYMAVLGDMFELGEYEQEGHLAVGRRAWEIGVDSLVTVGQRASLIAQGAREAGMLPNRIRHFLSRDEGLKYIKQVLKPEDVVLFKASRGMRFETLVEALFH